MSDTAQPLVAAETDPVAAAAAAFKAQREPEPAPVNRDEIGRFAPKAPEPAAEEAEPIEAEAEAGESAEDEAESLEIEEETEEAAEEAQPEAVDLPTSWPAEKAEMWKSLPPEAQAVIAEREGQRDAAVNAKFQEAANLRKAHEADIIEARTNRTKYAEAIDTVMSLVAPQRPSLTMLDINSSDYDPDAYHLANARYQEQAQYLQHLHHQRQQLAAQERAEAEAEEQALYQQVEQKARPAFLADVPEVTDPQKSGPTFQKIAEYVVNTGVPVSAFDKGIDSLSSAEWHIAWKAMKYDEMKAAKARVGQQPKPEPKKAAPAVRPGVTTPRSAVQQAQVKKDLDRVAREGTVEAGASLWKHFRQ